VPLIQICATVTSADPLASIFTNQFLLKGSRCLWVQLAFEKCSGQPFKFKGRATFRRSTVCSPFLESLFRPFMSGLIKCHGSI
jgi:hypothetical protein